MRLTVLLMPLFMLAQTAWAIDAGQAFDDPALQARYERIISEVRCLQCQNESIKDSNAFLAADLRREIRRMLGEGRSDDEIFDFLVQRYGDFALYRPRMEGKTLALWVIPAVLVLFGILIAFRVVRNRMALPVGEDADDSGSGDGR